MLLQDLIRTLLVVTALPPLSGNQITNPKYGVSVRERNSEESGLLPSN